LHGHSSLVILMVFLSTPKYFFISWCPYCYEITCYEALFVLIVMANGSITDLIHQSGAVIWMGTDRGYHVLGEYLPQCHF
jgi:hypothetical protein